MTIKTSLENLIHRN